MKKAAFVDLRSLNAAMQTLGVDHVNFKELLRIIRFEIGNCENLYNAPLVAAPSETEGNRKFYTKMRGLGYNVVSVTAEDQADDRALIKAIQDLDVSVVKEIVMVSSDSDFVSALRQKKQEGVADIYIMSARVADAKGASNIGGVLQDTFDKGEFRFVDMGLLKERLTYTKLPFSTAQPARQNGNGNGIHAPQLGLPAPSRYVVESTEPDVINAILELQERFPGSVRVRVQK